MNTFFRPSQALTKNLLKSIRTKNNGDLILSASVKQARNIISERILRFSGTLLRHHTFAIAETGIRIISNGVFTQEFINGIRCRLNLNYNKITFSRLDNLAEELTIWLQKMNSSYELEQVDNSSWTMILRDNDVFLVISKNNTSQP